MVLNGIEREPAADEKEAPPAENVDRDRWGPLHGTSDGEKSATHRSPATIESAGGVPRTLR